MDMKTILSALLALSVIAGVAGTANALDAKTFFEQVDRDHNESWLTLYLPKLASSDAREVREVLADHLAFVRRGPDAREAFGHPCRGLSQLVGPNLHPVRHLGE